MANLPTGTVTFLFTDIEGSTRLLQALGEGYRRVQDDHAAILRAAIAGGGGTEIRTEGDAFFAVFPSAAGAVRAAVHAQRALAAHAWTHGEPVRVRMGLHTGEGVLGGDDYLGIDVNRAARIAATGHGGQIVLSEATRVVVARDLPEGVSLRDLGEHRLKDIEHAERLYDLMVEGLPADFPPPRTLTAVWTVPAERSRFVGRAGELAALARLLGTSRLVTITGAGGSGKTRLAIHVAALVRDDFPDGVVFVELSPLTDPGLVPSAIAGATGTPEEGGVPIAETLSRQLRDRSMLLVLDNFEHILDAVPAVVALLDAAPDLRILTTSRVPLRLSGEQEFPLSPLEAPDPGEAAERLAENEAVSLFLDRARGVEPSFRLDHEELRIVAELCRRLDGLPLAIELAAARVRALPPSAILDRLGGRLDLLAGGARDAPARHRTLAEAIRWSDELLDTPASLMLRRLSVFAGGWTLPAADAVVNAGAELDVDTLDATEALLEHGLVRRDGARLRMLETVRAYAADALGGERAEIERRHARYFSDVAARAAARIDSATLGMLEPEHDNLRAALRWSERSDPWLGLGIGAGIWRFWQLRGHLAEGRATMERLLALAGSHEPAHQAARARGLVAVAGLAYWQNDFAAAGSAYQEAVAISREIGADETLGDAIDGLAFIRRFEGDVAASIELVAEARKVFERLGDPRRLAASTMSLGMMHMDVRDLDEGEAALHDALRRFEELGDEWGIASSTGALSQVAFRRGDHRRAVELCLRALDLNERIGDDAGMAVALGMLATVAVQRGDHETALLLAGNGEQLNLTSGARAPSGFLDHVDVRAAAEPVLGADETNRVWDRGRELDRDAVVSLARERLVPSS